ncbi:DsrE family protein [Azospirillum halopraeferens]|uniref:DsrE family protein n=1 Tax=Azospirillum halopraeferens TaxID=34010 RepID=UPI0004013A55|nr:DsrE family protein [Azospirillum halopraeferens]
MSVSRRIARLLLPLLLLAGTPAVAAAQDKVVYHIDDAALQGTKALRNIRNHLDVAPDTEIRVVTHADGIDLLLDGAKDEKNAIVYAPLIADLNARGVHFEVCEITIERRNLDKDAFIMEAEFTRSGVLRITRLQSGDGYAYIKP